jgi:cell shape-determining protein MreC
MKNRYVPSSVSGYVVDQATRAVLNTNLNEKRIYEAQVEQILSQKQHESEIKDLKSKLEKLEALVLKYL